MTQDERAARIRALLARREQADREIAKLLAEKKEEVGTEKWLKWCAKEFGWAKAMAYRHLDPKQMEASREAAKSTRCRQDGRLTPDEEGERRATLEDLKAKQVEEERRYFRTRTDARGERRIAWREATRRRRIAFSTPVRVTNETSADRGQM